MVETDISERWYIGSWALYKRLNLTQPTFLQRNVRQILETHQKDLAITEAPRQHLDKSSLLSFTGQYWKMPSGDRVAWQTPSYKTLEDLFDRKEPRLKVVLHDMRIGGVANLSPRRITYPDSPRWLPDPSETGKIPCVIDITIRASKVADKKTGVATQQAPPLQPLKKSQRATLIRRTEADGTTRFKIKPKNHFYVNISELPGDFVNRKRNGVRKWGYETFPEYRLELDIWCANSAASTRLLPIVDPSLASEEWQDTPYWESSLFAKCDNIFDCPQPRETLAIVRKSTSAGKTARQLTKYTLDVDMDWSEWPEPQSVLGVWNREMNAFDPLRTQLPTPSASEHTDMSVLPDGSTSMEPENKRIVYVFEPGNDNPPRVFTQEGLKCVFCQSRGIQNSWDQLHFHYLTNHEYFKFTITDEDPRGTEKPAWKVVYIELGDLRPFGRPSNNDRDYRELNWVQPSQPFDLTAYLRGEGDPCWEPSGKVTKPIAKGPGKRRPGYSRQISEKPQRFVPTLKEPELVGDLPSKKRKRFVVPPIKDANGHPVQLFRSISKRSIYPGEELSESDDDVDLNWLKLKQDTRRFPGLSKQAQDFIRLFDDYMEVEHLCGDRFVGDALVRFLKKYAKELGQCSQPCRDKINQLWEDGIITEQTQSWCLDWIAGRNRSDDTASSSRGYPDPPENGIASDKLHRPLVPESETEKGEKSGKQAALSDTPLDTPPPKRRKYMPGGSGGGGRYVEVEGPEEATISASTKPSKDAASVQVNLSADTAAAQQPALQGSKPSSCVCGKDVESARGSVLCANVVSF